MGTTRLHLPIFVVGLPFCQCTLRYSIDARWHMEYVWRGNFMKELGVEGQRYNGTKINSG